MSSPLRNRHPADRDLEEGIHLPEAQRRAGRLVLFQEPLRGMELLSLPALVPASNFFSSWNLSFGFHKMSISITTRIRSCWVTNHPRPSGIMQ